MEPNATVGELSEPTVKTGKRQKLEISILMVLSTFLLVGCEPVNFRENFGFTTESDEFTGVTTTQMVGISKVPGCWYLSARRLVSEDGHTTYLLDYQGYTQLSPREFMLLVDGERHRLSILDSKRKYDSMYVSACAYVSPLILKHIANATEVKLRVVGYSSNCEARFDERYHYYFKRFYEECVLGHPSRGEETAKKVEPELKIFKCIDQNSDGEIGLNECSELSDGDSINLNNFELTAIYSPVGDGSKKVEYSVWDPDGNSLGEVIFPENRLITTIKGKEKGDCFDNLNGRSRTKPGKYLITAEKEGNLVSTEVSVFRK